ncbi:MAG: PD40 domain-containing protein [Bacteroidales bacterium]|nr:PD40 domain-containing protein [Bacteroidales bacterium]
MRRFYTFLLVLSVSLCKLFIANGQVDTSLVPNVIDVGQAQFKVVGVEWANKVISFSSEYSPKIKSANQVLGKPNVFPIGGSSPCAWTYAKKAKNGDEFIRVSFQNAIKVKQVAIFENYKPGAVEKITLYGKNPGEEKVVYQSTAQLASESKRVLNIFFEETTFEVQELELRLNSEKVSEFEIDAIGVSNTTDSIKARINVPVNLKYQAVKESLGPAINSEFDERAPIISADSKEIFFVRKNHPQNTGGSADEDDIWYSKILDGQWMPAVNIGSPLNTNDNNFAQSITPDGNMILLANIYVKEGRNVTLKPGASVSYKTRTGWSFPVEQKIKDFKNNSAYVNYYLSANGKYLLMAIEGDDSYGGLDLYVSFRNGENSWSKPINLGPDVNTAANDYSPFLAADGITLYYSTSGLSGYGKEDIFVTRRLDDTWMHWSEPMNMGKPINSPESDSKFSIPASGSYAYFSSKEGSVGLYDIFRILLPDTAKPQAVALLKGSVMDMTTKEPIGGAIIIYKNYPDEAIVIKEISDSLTGKFSVYLPVGNKYTAVIKANGYIDGKQSLDLTSIYNFTIIEQQPILMVKKSAFKTIKGKLNDKLTDKSIAGAKVALVADSASGKIIAVTYANDKGEFEFKLENFDENEKVLLLVEQDNYQQKVIELGDISNETEIPLDLNLDPVIKKDKVIEFHNIYFDYGKATLREESKEVLDRIVAVMNENPTLEIELS